MRLYLDGAELCGGAVETGVHVLVAIDSAKALGEIYSLVDHDSIRHFDVIAELVEADPENCPLDRIELVQGPIGKGLDLRLEGFAVPDDLGEPLVEHRLLDALVVGLLTILQEQLTRIVIGYLVLVQRLNEELMRPRSSAA